MTENRRFWQRAIVGGVVACGLTVSLGSALASAEPADPAQPTPGADAQPASAQMTGDQALALIAQQYATGAGGGQVSNLIQNVVQLRNQGFKPSQANQAAIIDALDHRPNQTPLVRALQDTLSYQLKLKQRSEATQGGSNPFTIGINQYDPENPGVLGTFGITPGG